MNISEGWTSYRTDLWSSAAHLRRLTSTMRPFWVFFFSLPASSGPFSGVIGLICLSKQRERGHEAMDNPIYGFAIYYKFLWLLGPLSHRFVDCLLSWVLMSCCLNHCIIAALIHFLGHPRTHSACWFTTTRKKGKNGTLSSEQTISTIILERKCHFANVTL